MQQPHADIKKLPSLLESMPSPCTSTSGVFIWKSYERQNQNSCLPLTALCYLATFLYAWHFLAFLYSRSGNREHYAESPSVDITKRSELSSSARLWRTCLHVVLGPKTLGRKIRFQICSGGHLDIGLWLGG